MFAFGPVVVSPMLLVAVLSVHDPSEKVSKATNDKSTAKDGT